MYKSITSRDPSRMKLLTKKLRNFSKIIATDRTSVDDQLAVCEYICVCSLLSCTKTWYMFSIILSVINQLYVIDLVMYQKSVKRYALCMPINHYYYQ